MDLANRRPGPDVVRALAMAGVVVMNYHGYLIIRGGQRSGGFAYDLFDPWTGPLSTRFATTFVLTAGVGVTLMTASSIGDSARETDVRWRLVRRGFVLYSFGLLFDFIWAGTILPFYGAMFAIAAVIFTWRSRWVLSVGAAAILAGWLINWWRYDEQVAGNPHLDIFSPGPRSPSGLVFDVFINGTHPLLPWLGFFCVGIVLGRVLHTAWWRPAAIGVGLTMYSLAGIVATIPTTERGLVIWSDLPSNRGIVYSANVLGTALVAFAVISWIADRAVTGHTGRGPVVDSLQRAGQMSLTIYIGHALVFNLLVDWLEIIEPGGLGLSLSFAAVYWVIATALAVAYQRRYGRGPTERIFRRLTA